MKAARKQSQFKAISKPNGSLCPETRSIECPPEAWIPHRVRNDGGRVQMGAKMQNKATFRTGSGQNKANLPEDEMDVSIFCIKDYKY